MRLISGELGLAGPAREIHGDLARQQIAADRAASQRRHVALHIGHIRRLLRLGKDRQGGIRRIFRAHRQAQAGPAGEHGHGRQFRRGPGDRPIDRRDRDGDAVPRREDMRDVVEIDRRLVFRAGPQPHRLLMALVVIEIEQAHGDARRAAVRCNVVQAHGNQR